MKTINNTPSVYSDPVPKPELAGKELLYKLEDDYAEYRSACNNGYCKADPAVHAKFKADIAAANAPHHPRQPGASVDSKSNL
jgi:hypothetical protein